MEDSHRGIRFGNWELRPTDSRNWELYHLRASTRGFGDGTPRWASEGRFYQYNTIPNAIKYAADYELMDKCHGTVMELWDALAEYNRIIDALKADVIAALGGAR